MVEAMKEREKITLVLGSGGARGIAHIGVIQYLEEHQIPIHAIVGSSIGAMIGGVYASGMGTRQLAELVHAIDKLTMAKMLLPGFSASGIFNNNGVRKFIHDIVGETRIENLPVVFCAVATDLITGEEVVIEKGRLADALVASSAVPAMFQPVYHQERYLVDGGLSNPLPISVARRLSAHRIVAVNVAPNPDRLRTIIQEKMKAKRTRKAKTLPAWLSTLLQSSGYMFSEKAIRKSLKDASIDDDIYLPSAFRVSLQTVLISANNLIMLHLKHAKPDMLIAPKIETYDMFDFHKGKDLIECGYDAAKAAGLENLLQSHAG
jgi:NTE family protein